ncbi:MAG: ComEC/Rec2 family competence protein [Clostridia bacterium]|nr:ComEC/Rec2 family competence protein [Clostridia bacterium]
MISRPFALIGFSFTLTFLALSLFEDSALVISVSAAACLIICFFAKRLKGRWTAEIFLLCVICACLWFSLHDSFVYKTAVNYAGSNTQVTARIISLPERSEKGWFYTLKSSEIGGEKAEYKISFFSKELLDAEPYDEISFRAELYSIDASEAQSYYKPKGIYLQSFWHSKSVITKAADRPIGYYLLKAKDYAVKRLGTVMGGEEADLAAAMLTGDKSGLSDETVAAFSRAGLSHAMAVSGLHMSIIVMGLYKLLMLFCRRIRWLPGIVCTLVSFVYAGVAGFSMSAVRSCLMITVMLLGSAFFRRSDSLNSLGLAALIITLVNPFAVLDWSFMLSFSATLGIILCSKHINLISGRLSERIKIRVLRYFVRTVVATALISLAATVFCLPVTLFFIGGVSLVFLPANLLTLYAVPLALVSAMFALVPWGVISGFAATVCEAVCGYILKAVRWLASFEFAYISTDYTLVKLSFTAVAAVIALERFVLKDNSKFLRSAVLTVSFAVAVNIVLMIFLNG